ncbi:hypothetical protein FQR65_LT04996 [Abscondita terminalis]|nr:hypothetical protein FQR65_LT04996 [Abscondita terminalis]
MTYSKTFKVRYSPCVTDMTNTRVFFFVFVTIFGNCYGKTNPSVIVVGAGAAGIAATTRLLKNGIDNVIILEAEDRIGGRVYSVKFGETYVDLGAEWCHGQKDNVVYELVKNLNVLVSDEDATPVLIHSKLKTIKPNFTEQLFGIFLEVYNEDRDGVNGTLGDYVSRKYRNVVENLWRNDTEELKVALDCVDLLEKIVLSYEGAFSWHSVAADTDYVECEGDQQLAWNGRGYKTILEVLMQKFPEPKDALPMNDKIVLNKEVNLIHWNSTVDGEEKVVVTCADGTKYIADHVILTVSLGVLKNQHKTLIVPNLSKEKSQAVEQLGFEAVFKVVLYFEHPWWNSTFPGYSFVWDADDQDHFSEGPIKYPPFSDLKPKSWVTSIVIIMPVSGSSNALSLWFTGQFVPEIERFSDETIINGFVHLMSKFQGWIDPVRPQNLTRHAWYSNPHFRGTYSYQTLEARADGRSKEKILSEPIATPRGKLAVLFAGEATHPTQFSQSMVQ